jgi:CRP-like cAMP-binding protein
MSSAESQALPAAQQVIPPLHVQPGFDVAKLDQQTLLTVVELRCADGLRMTTISPDHCMVKLEPSRRYLGMGLTHWKSLRAFGNGPGKSVPQVLFQLIMDRDCVQLREFYEIIIKAYQNGILHTEGSPPPAQVKPARWPHELTGSWARYGAVLAVALAATAIFFRPLSLPSALWEIAFGWIMACGAVSAGNWLGAAVVRHGGAEVYSPRFVRRSPFPRFEVDLGDAIMAGTATVADAALAQLAPAFLALGFCALLLPGSATVVAVAVVVTTAPFWWSPGLRVIHALTGRQRSDDKWDFQFEPNRTTWYSFITRLRSLDLRFLGLHLLYSLVWISALLLTTGLLLSGSWTDLWRDFHASGGPRLTAFIVAAIGGFVLIAALSGLGAVAYLAWREWADRRPWQSPPPTAAEATPEGIARCVSESLLFQLLPAADRALLAGCFHAESFPARSTIIREGESGDKLYLLFSGRVEVTRALPNGREDHVAELLPGDVFGEIAVLNRSPRTRSIRCLEPAIVLSLTREAFEGMVLSRLSRTQIEDAVQKIAFLQRTPLAAGWSPHALAAFARRASFQDYPADAYVLHEGEDNHFFYLVHEGRLAVQRGREEIAQLGIGDFFGEISLLQNSITKATIVTRTPARFLVMHKRDFLQFFAKDSAIGLQFEAISSRRLGEPIFPLRGKSLDLLKA